MGNFDTFQLTDEWQQLGLPARDFYSYEVDYHNWDHALDIAGRCFAIAEVAADRGIHCAAGRLAVAAAWHDAGHHADHRRLGFATKEQYSMSLAGDFLRVRSEFIQSLVQDPESPMVYIGDVRKAIEGTMHGAKRRDMYALMLHRADIENIGGDTGIFVANAWKLFRESRRTRPNLLHAAWKEKTVGFIETVTIESPAELAQLQYTTSEIDAFCTRAERNVERLRLLTEPEHRDLAEAA